MSFSTFHAWSKHSFSILLVGICLLASPLIQAQTWINIATDITGDEQPTLPDGTGFFYAYDPVTDTLCFRIDVLDLNPFLGDFGVNIQVEIPGVVPTLSWGAWGPVQNTTFNYNRLITVWVTGTPPSTYAGTIGIADPTGVGMGNFANLSANNMNITTDGTTNQIVIKMPRQDLITNAMLTGSMITFNVAGTVGGSMAWSDDIFTGPGTATINTTIPLAVPALANPMNMATNISVNTTLQWGPVTGATNYNYEYSTDPNFVLNVTSGSITTAFVGVGPLDGNTNYYWRVNATDGTQTTAWSPFWRFKTGDAPLVFPPPTLWLPPDNSFDQEAPQLTLNWDDVFGANRYDLQWGTDPSLASNTEHNPANSIFTISGLNFLETYYWRVRAKNDTLVGPWSDTWNFSTRAQDLSDGIADPSEEAGYTFFPNPSFGPVSVYRTKSFGAVQYQLFDPVGKLVLTGTTSEQNFLLDLSPYQPGIYNLVFEEEERIYYQRLIRR